MAHRFFLPAINLLIMAVLMTSGLMSNTHIVNAAGEEVRGELASPN